MILQQNVSFLMFPFTLMKTGDNPSIGLDDFRMPDTAVWKSCKMSVDKDVFFSHIQSFLQKSVLGEVECVDARTCDFLVYSCGDEAWNNRFFNPASRYVLKMKDRNFRFAFHNNSATFLSPKLVVYPDASVGVIMIPVWLTDERVDMKMLMDFVNQIQKLDRQQKPFMLERPEKDNGKEKYCRKMKDLVSMLHIEGAESGAEVSFFLSQVVNVLLDRMDVPYPRALFMPKRCHVFSYFHVTQAEADASDEKLWKDDLLRIARCQNQDFLVMPEERSVTQTFRNVYIAVNVEGAAVMTVGDVDFYRKFMTNNFVQRYMWLYVLVFLQRYSLINMSRGIGAIDNDGDKKNIVSLKCLRGLYEHLTRITVNSYFSDVSDYTQHNEFYHFCCQRLGVVKLLNDVEHKMRTLDECLRQKVDKRGENIQFLLAIFIILLTVFSAVNDGMQLVGGGFFSFVPMGVATFFFRLLFLVGIVLVIVLFVQFWRNRK